MRPGVMVRPTRDAGAHCGPSGSSAFFPDGARERIDRVIPQYSPKGAYKLGRRTPPKTLPHTGLPWVDGVPPKG